MKTVNFLEAVNSGKRFKPDYESTWYYFQGDVLMRDGYVVDEFCKSFISSQFILEEKTITITESEFDDVFNNNFLRNGISIHLSFSDFKKELGF